MKRFRIALAFFLICGTLCRAQDISLDGLIPPAKQKQMGLHKLTQAEKKRLRDFILDVMIASRKSGARSVSSQPSVSQAPTKPRSTKASPPTSRPAAAYGTVGAGHWVKENVDRGAFIRLEDGSLWEIDRLERLNARLWLRTARIVVLTSTRGSPGYGYLLLNIDDGEKAHAKYIGKPSLGIEPARKSAAKASRPASPDSPTPVIESKINGEFEGWDGKTIVKLMNGQIWQQAEYFYHYHYAYMPKVFIFKNEGVSRMKVEGVDKAIAVRQLK